MTPRDAFWDELGVAWSAINPDINVLAPRLEARLRRQSLLITAGLAAGALLSSVGVLLGLFTFWSGWTTGAWNFVTRGLAIETIAIMLAIGVSLLLPVRASDAARAVSDMLDLAIARAERTLVTLRLGLYGCLVAAVLGLLGAAIRTSLTGPPQLSPVVDLVILVLFAWGLFVYGRHVRITLDRLRALKHVLGVDGGSQ
jgi:ABC-type amino acid transport system permease subunit